MKHMHLADVSIRCSNPPQGKTILFGPKGGGGGVKVIKEECMGGGGGGGDRYTNTL